ALWSVWNEPNLQLFLTPQFAGKKIVGPANYAKLFKAAYAGIKSGDPWSKVAIGETSARGRDKPLKGVSASIAPGTFARLLAQVKGLKFDAWAHHPYPTSPNLPPMQKVRYPNVTLSTLPKFQADLKTWFHRTVPIWITEYGHETKPAQPHGVTYAQQAAYAKQALTYAKNDPDVQMFIWFVYRDSVGNPWRSGLYSQNGAQKPAFDAFGSVARLIDGTTTTTKPGVAPHVTMYVPYLAYYSPPGTTIGMTYVVYDAHAATVAVGQPTSALAPDESITFTPAFKPVKGQHYTVVATANEPNGHSESRTAYISVS
ncbi:MAG TPA: glycosyl hydrolase, partial [Gaiellaceae bacterium]|nr:glycosyl hydrolase [Gaiellaceae bacterium]